MPDFTDQQLLDDLVATCAELDPITDDDMIAYVNMAANVPDLARNLRPDRDSYDEWVTDTLRLIAEVRRLRAAIAKVVAIHKPHECGCVNAGLCETCDSSAWPCPTHAALHPEETDHV